VLSVGAAAAVAPALHGRARCAALMCSPVLLGEFSAVQDEYAGKVIQHSTGKGCDMIGGQTPLWDAPPAYDTTSINYRQDHTTIVYVMTVSQESRHVGSVDLCVL
jgi:hypothetical protein